MGPKTKAAAQAASPNNALREIVALRGQHYGSLETFERYSLGWMRRLADMHQRALVLVKEG